MVPKLVLPDVVSSTPARELGESLQPIVAVARKPHLSLHEQVKQLMAVVAKPAEVNLSLVKLSAASPKNVNDKYDWFFLVERCDGDSDVLSLWSALQVMSEYAALNEASTSLTHVEEMVLVEALQAIVENMGEV
jgi:hypothetical protein